MHFNDNIKYIKYHLASVLKKRSYIMSDNHFAIHREILSHNLKTLREYLGKNQKTFSIEASISTPTLSSYENGATLPSLWNFYFILKQLIIFPLMSL